MNFASSDIRDSAKSAAGDGNPMICTTLILVMYTVVLMQPQIKTVYTSGRSGH